MTLCRLIPDPPRLEQVPGIPICSVNDLLDLPVRHRRKIGEIKGERIPHDAFDVIVKLRFERLNPVDIGDLESVDANLLKKLGLDRVRHEGEEHLLDLVRRERVQVVDADCFQIEASLKPRVPCDRFVDGTTVPADDIGQPDEYIAGRPADEVPEIEALKRVRDAVPLKSTEDAEGAASCRAR
jgi:hypothetical protein